MNILLYKTFTVNQGSTLPSYLAILIICCLPVPWQYGSILYPLVLGTLPVLFLFQRDAKDHWFALVPSLPIAPEKVIAEKYLLSALSALLIPAVMAAGQWISSYAPAPSLGNLLNHAGFLLLDYAVMLPLTFRRGPHRPLVPYLLAIAFVILVILACNACGFYVVSTTLSPLPVVTILLLFLGSALLFAASFPLAQRWYLHRRW